MRRKVQGASRTDAGVHAEGQVAHFDYDGEMDAYRLRKGLNAVTDRAVRVLEVEATDPEFHARHDARGKQYRYDIWAHAVHHPLYRGTTLHVWRSLDLEAVRRAAPHFLGERDFSALRAAGCDARTPVTRLTRLELVGSTPALSVIVEGTSFLKYMVRNLVGTLIDVGVGRREPDSIPDLLAARDRHQAGQTAAPHGLRLMWVRYPRPAGRSKIVAS